MRDGHIAKSARAGMTASVAAIAMLTNAQSAFPAENRHILPNETAKSTAARSLNGDEFDARWGETQDAFVLGSDGVVAAEKTMARAAQETNSIAYIENDVKGSLNNAFAFTESNQNGKTESSPPVSNGQCKPSAMSEAEINALVKDMAHRHGVDAGFAVAIAWAESNFGRNLNSSAGARGPMQLMPATAERFGVQDICDTTANIDGGVRYLRVLLDEFQNPLLAAAAYNSGEQRIYEYGGIPPFAETLNYVARVVNYQLGVTLPASRRKTNPEPTTVVTHASAGGGVIPVEKTKTFVAGIMHF